MFPCPTGRNDHFQNALLFFILHSFVGSAGVNSSVDNDGGDLFGVNVFVEDETGEIRRRGVLFYI